MNTSPLDSLTLARDRDPHFLGALPGTLALRPSEPLARLPALGGSGPSVDPRACIEPRTGLAILLAASMAVLGAVLLIGTIYGALIAIVMGLLDFYATRRAKTILKASALRVGPQQFSAIHECSKSFAQRLSLKEAPEIYVIDAAEVNGFALRLGRKGGVFLTDEAVAGCLEGRSPAALAFVIAHELAHLSLGHHRWWRRVLCKFRWLSRLDECSADNVACELVGSFESAQDGVLLLVAGPRLLSLVDRDAALAQAAEVARDKSARRVERMLTHPLILRRLHRVAKRFESSSNLRRAA